MGGKKNISTTALMDEISSSPTAMSSTQGQYNLYEKEPEDRKEQDRDDDFTQTYLKTL